MKKSKYILQIGLWFSFMAFFMLCITKSKSAFAFSGIMALLVTIAAIKISATKIGIKPYITLYSGIVSVCINVFLARRFYLVWYDSEKINAITQRVGIAGSNFVLVLTVLGAFVAIPSIAWLIGGLRYICTSSKMNSVIEAKGFNVLCIVISIVGIGIQLFYSFSMDIWVDETFSLMITRFDYSELIELTAADVHPPLYYIILKICIDCAHIIFNKNIETVYLAKIISVIPFILTLLLCVTKIRKKWGYYASGISAVCLIGMPNMIEYSVEIRMYSWGLFFVTGAFLCFADIMSEKGRLKKTWIGLVLYSLAASYTHYFACVSVALLYLTLLFYFLVLKQKENVKRWLVASCVTMIAYMPWLIKLIGQLKKVKEDYWISPINEESLKSYVYYIWKNNWLLAVCLIVVLLFIQKVLDKSEKIEWESAIVALTAFMIPIGTAAVGIIASFAIRPVFVARYMIPGVFCLWIGTALMVLFTQNWAVKVIYATLILLVSIGQVQHFSSVERLSRDQAQQVWEIVLRNIDAVFLCDSLEVQKVLATRVQIESYWLGGRKANYSVYQNLDMGYLSRIDDITRFLNEGKTVYLFSINETEDREIKKAGLACEKIGQYEFAQYDVMQIYQISSSE